MKPDKKVVLKQFIGRILNSSKQLLFGLLLAVVVIGGFNFGGEVRVVGQTNADADKIALKVDDGNSFGRAVVTEGIYRGMIDCYEKTTSNPDVGDWFKKSTLEQYDNSCTDFVLAGETVGQPYRGSNNQLFNIRSDTGSRVQTLLSGATILYSTGKGYVVKNNSNGTTRTLTSDEIKEFEECNNRTCTIPQSNYQKITDKFGPGLATNSSAGRIFKLQMDNIGGVNPLTEADKVAAAMSTNGATCNAFVDANNVAVYRCRKGSPPNAVPTGPNGTDLPASCTAKSAAGDILFKYNGTTVTCDINSAAQDAILADPKNTDNRTQNLVQKTEGAFDDLGAFLFKVVVWVLAWILVLIGNAGFFILWALGGFVLWILAQNPATPAFVELLRGPWGLLAGLGNLMVLGAFLYTGFGYLLGITNMKKDLGDFIQKIIYYALILNFTLFGLATLANIGYGLGNLIKVSYSNSTSKEDVNNQLVGSLLNGIGGVSTIRCGTNVPDCKVIDDKGGLTKNNDGKAFFDGIFGASTNKTGTNEEQAISGAITAIVMEIVTLGMMIVAGIVLWRALYTTFYRFMGILFIMMLSPIGAASIFSPIDSWQGIGKQMWEKFWKMVAFYPAFIFGLILVNLLSSGFAEANKTSATSVANAGEGLTQLLTKIVGAGISIMGLWLITDYFAKSFEEDMNKIGSGVKSAVSSGWDGLQKVGKFGNGALKLGGGTIANAGRLLSTGTNMLGAGRYFKSQANKAANEAERLKKELDSNVDSKTGEELTEQQKANKLSQIQYLRREEDNYKDLQRRGIGRSFISAGNTIGYGGDRALSTAKNIAGYFGKLEKSYEAEDDIYWQTQMNRGLKRLGGNDMADIIFSGAANVGITADAEAAIAEEAMGKGLSNPFDNILNDQRDEAIKGSLGLKERELRRDVAQKLIPHLINKARGDLANLSQAEMRLLEQVVDKSADDEQLGRELFGTKDGANLVQQMTADNMISSSTGTKLAENWGNTLGTKEERLSAGARLAKDQKAFEKADKSVFSDPDILEGYKQAMNGDLSAIGKSKGNYGRLHDNESIDAAKKVVAELAPVTGKKEYRDAVETATNSIQDNFRTSAFTGHQDVLHELAALHSDETLSEADFKTASDAVMVQALVSQFGIPADQAALLLEKNGATKVIQSKDIETMFDAGGDPTTAATMVEELIKKSDIALYAKNNVKKFDEMPPVQQLEIIKQATLQQMVSANKNVDTYRAKANATSAGLSEAKKKGARRAKVHETAKSATDAVLGFTTNKTKIPSNDKDAIANLQRAMLTGNQTLIDAELTAMNVTDPKVRADALEAGKKAILANGATKVKGDLEDAFATGSTDEMTKFLVEKLGVDRAANTALNIPAAADIAKEIRRQAGSSASVQADIVDEFSQAMAKFAENGGSLNPTTDTKEIEILKKFGIDTSINAKFADEIKTKGNKVFAAYGSSADPGAVLNGLSESHKSKAGKAYGDTLKPVQELDPDHIVQS